MNPPRFSAPPRLGAPLGLALALGLALPLSAQPAAPPAPTDAEARGAARALYAEGAFEEQHERDPSRAQALYRRALERARAAGLRALAREAEAAIARCDAKLGRAARKTGLPASAYLLLEQLQTKWESDKQQMLLRYGERLLPSLLELVIDGRTFGPDGKRYLLPTERCVQLLRWLHDSPAKGAAIQRLVSHTDALVRAVGIEVLDDPRHLQQIQAALASKHEVERIAALNAGSSIYHDRPLPRSLVAAIRSAVLVGTQGAHHALIQQGPEEQLWLADLPHLSAHARADALRELSVSAGRGMIEIVRALPVLIRGWADKAVEWNRSEGLLERAAEQIEAVVAAHPQQARQLERFLLTLPPLSDQPFWRYRRGELREGVHRLRLRCAGLATLEAFLAGETRDRDAMSAAVRNLTPSPQAARMLERIAATPSERLTASDWETMLSAAARHLHSHPTVLLRLLELLGERFAPAAAREALTFRLGRPAPALARKLEAALLPLALSPTGEALSVLTDVAGVPTFAAVLQRSPQPNLEQLCRIVEQLPPEAYPELRAAVEGAPTRARPVGVLALLRHSNPRLSRGVERTGGSPEECDARQAQDLRWLDRQQRRTWGSQLLNTLRAGSQQQQRVASDLAHEWEALPLDLLCDALTTLSQHRPQRPSFPLLETLTQSLGKPARNARGPKRLVDLWEREAQLSPSRAAAVVSASFGALLRESPPPPRPQPSASPTLRAWLANPAMFFALRDPVAAFERHLPALAERGLLWPITRLFLVQIEVGERQREDLRLFVPAWSRLEARHRRELLSVVAVAPTRAALPLVERGLAEVDSQVRGAAERALEKMGVRRRLEEELAQQRTGIADPTLRELVELLDDEQDSVAVAAAQALGKLGRAETLPLLIRKLGKSPRAALKHALEDAISAISSAAKRPAAR